MEEGKEMKLARFSSCRGVSFEINGNRSSPFAIESPTKPERSTGTWLWIPWTRNNSFKILHQPHAISPTRSRASSHFCDINIDADDVELEFLSEVHDDIEKNQEKVKVLPKKEPKTKNTRLSIILLDQGFTVYKGLFMVCITLNMLALGLSISGHFPYAKSKATLFSIGNILALTLCRSEAFLRILFWFVVKTIGKPYVSLRIKTATTSFLQSVGGIHSGCGVSSIAWLVYSLVLTIKNNDKTTSSPVILGVAFAILSLITLSSLAAFPLLRHLHHNVFERIHRFSDGKKDHMMLAGAVGDFTKSLVSSPPSHLWIRSVHFAGLPYLKNEADVYLIWVAKDIEMNFGNEIKELVGKYSNEKVIVHDTAVSGRPNVAEISVNAAINWNVEVVIVTSNPEGSRDVVRACNKAKIPAFGPIWDS
ncbi:hypothetical protein TSUD_103910 [Trifolium subterraneum]|uniref:Uncharacterized protein n=1 Tax=Trifolium subterraneum TaxID=3900 RepID=A0A2Z6MPG4_TRISU|nr:hypothetical protein TSUD_103910 [Trifolium subterraneum]